MSDNWRVEDWYISDVHTGWRIVKGYGTSKEIHKQGFAYNWMILGDQAAKREGAFALCNQLNREQGVDR